MLERQTHLKVNSYNAGRSGNNTLHCINVLMNKVVNLKPEIVALMENINALAILMYDKTYWNDNPSRSPLIEKPPNFKTVGQDLEQTFHLVREFSLNLQTFINICRAREITPVKENIADVAHFNDQGSRLVAARIAAALTPIIARLGKKPLSGN